MDAARFPHALALARARSNRQQWEDAVARWEEVVTANPVHGGHWAELARAREGAGHHADAAAAYERALEIGVWQRSELIYPGAIAYRIAACQARAGQPEAALAALERARDLGYREFANAAEDEDLAALHDDPRFRQLVGSPEVTGLSRDDGWRADLAVLTREVKRRAYDPFRQVAEADFDAAAATLSTAVPRLTDAQIVVELHRLLARLGDGHAGIEVPDTYPQLHQSLPLQLYLFEEGLFVTAAAPEQAHLLGAQLHAFDGRPVAEVLAAVDPLISRDNAYGPRHHAPTFLRRLPYLHALGLAAEPDRVELSVQDLDGGSRTVEVGATAGRATDLLPSPAGWHWLPGTLSQPLPYYLRHCGVPYWFDHLPEHHTVYCQLNSLLELPEDRLDEHFRRLFDLVSAQPVEKLVLDLRFNGGGNTFLAMPLLHRIIANERINQRGRLFVIIGRRTFSAAQNTATLLDRHTEALFVGEPSGSRPTFIGETIPFPLPYSGLRANVSDLLWQTSWPMDHRAWLAPDLYTPPTFEAYRHNRDPALAAILDCDAGLPGW